jgi:hypothetical protein
MAAKKTKASDEATLPTGFVPVSGGKIDGWFVVKPNNSIQGILRDKFVVKGKFGNKRVYKIEVTDGETDALDAEDGEFTAAGGEMIGLDEKGWLKSLNDVPNGTKIYVRCLGREATAKKGQQPAWKFLVGAIPADERDVPIR